jgi:transposase
MLNILLDCKLIFLPFYFPDLNPIKQAFLAIKSYLRWYCYDFTFSSIDRTCQNISFESAWAFFHALGYIV